MQYTFAEGSVELVMGWGTCKVEIKVGEDLTDTLYVDTTRHPLQSQILKRVHAHMQARVREYPPSHLRDMLQDKAWENFQHRGNTFDRQVMDLCVQSRHVKPLKSYEKMKPQIRRIMLALQESEQ